MGRNLEDFLRERLIRPGDQAHLARAIGVTRTAVNGWLRRGARPDRDYVTAVAEYYGVPRNELLAMCNYQPELSVAEDGGIGYGVATNHVPVVGRIEAGKVHLPREWTDGGYPAGAAEEYVPATAPTKTGAFALRVEGNSMEPRVPKGVIVIICPDVLFVPGQIHLVIATKNRKWLKRVTHDEAAGEYILTSDNPAYPPIQLPEREMIRLHPLEWIKAY